MSHDGQGPRIVQMARQCGGVAAVVAAAHEQPDMLSLKVRYVTAENSERGAGRIFHEHAARQSELEGSGIPCRHFLRQGQGRAGTQEGIHHADSRMTTAAATCRSWVMVTCCCSTSSRRASAAAGP